MKATLDTVPTLGLAGEAWGGFESSPAVTHEPRSVPKPGRDKSCRHVQNGGHVCVTSRSMCNDRPRSGIKCLVFDSL